VSGLVQPSVIPAIVISLPICWNFCPSSFDPVPSQGVITSSHSHIFSQTYHNQLPITLGICSQALKAPIAPSLIFQNIPRSSHCFSCSFFLLRKSKARFASSHFCFACFKNSISLSLYPYFFFNCIVASFCTGCTGSGIHIGSEVFIGLCVVKIHIPVFCGHCENCIFGAIYELVLGACGVKEGNFCVLPVN
jgi:hypothetical protein